jgi:hypothetical protein
MFVAGEYFATGNPGGDGDWKLVDTSVGGYPIVSKILRSGDCFSWAAIAAFIATLLAAKAGETGEKAGETGEEVVCWSLAGVGEGVEVGVFSKSSGGLFFFFFFLHGDLVGSSLSSVVS